MGALLRFFTGPLAVPATLLRIKALLIGALVMLAACLALTVWALWERSGKLTCAVERVTLADQVRVLADQLQRQNAGIEATQRAGADAQAATRALLAAATKLGAQQASLMLDVREVLNRPTPLRADGKPAGCDEAWAQIEQRAVRK